MQIKRTDAESLAKALTEITKHTAAIATCEWRVSRQTLTGYTLRFEHAGVAGIATFHKDQFDALVGAFYALGVRQRRTPVSGLEPVGFTIGGG